MKEKEFDNLIKTKVDNVDDLQGIAFEEDVVWEKVSTKISKNTNGGIYLLVFTSIIILIGIIYFFLFTPSYTLSDEKEISLPTITEETIVIDTITNQKKKAIQKAKIVAPKKNNFKNKLAKKAAITTEDPIVDTKDTVNTIDKVNQKLIDTSQSNESLKISNQNKFYKVNFGEVTETRAYVHVYRPGKIAGALNMFSLKANGKKIGTITNGEYEVFMVESGLTEFEIKRKKIKIKLEARKSYYLRTELIFLGKTKFEQVTESYAKEELSSMK
ncbi:DUF2846 domain-containing protein [Aquimarina sp. 2201CG5-10]|uniref:DUF2846 domain-containing protein n=1 Tax=Aquimarina callyspongiae TaxID=3098150 RepID=UPI002AB42F7F|nr:DUF2846 domain-containing protein [Aquimarina sp. 2201CG5-10]MDY8136047.1 DUF2846 domain-containing protein [Aquimarina sp. 2201CG5-10]